MCDGAGARYLVRGSLKTRYMYIDVASPPSLAPQLNIFVIQHSFASSWKHLSLCQDICLMVRAVTLYEAPQSYAGCGISGSQVLRFSGFRYPRLVFLFFIDYLLSRWIQCRLSRIYRPQVL